MSKIFGDEEGFCWDAPIKAIGRSASGQESGPRVKAFRQALAPAEYRLPQIGHRFSQYPRIAFDVESKDPYLKEKGPGYQRKDAFIVGWGLCSDHWAGGYYPVRHKHGPNLDPKLVAEWISDEMAGYKGEIVGANLLYDGEAADSEMVTYADALIRDVQWAAPLINENQRKYNLDALSSRFLGMHKVKAELIDLYGEGFIENMDLVHPGHAEPYVMGDLHLPFQLMDAMRPIMERDGTWSLFNLEARMYQFLLYLRKQGVRIDISGAEQLGERLGVMLKQAQSDLKEMVGWVPNVGSSGDMARAFDKLGLKYPRTQPTKNAPNGNPSFKKEFLAGLEHPIGELIQSVKKAQKFSGDFVTKWQDMAVDGRLHCMFHPQKSDTNGTVSGRLSSSHPNLQQVPTRDDVFGPLIRGLFIPEEGCDWWSADYSQIEYRLLVHYAFITKMLGADVAAKMYIDDPRTDFHVLAAALTGKPRKVAKNINFGIVYGMGEAHMADVMGCLLEMARSILAEYHEKMPFAKQLYSAASARAANTGVIRTILGRLRHFDFWEPAYFIKPGSDKWQELDVRGLIVKDKPGKPGRPSALEKEEAIAVYGPRIRRAFTHKALNALLQGSAADMMKMASVLIWEKGLVGPTAPLICHLTVHDELDGSKPRGNALADEAYEELQLTMREAVPLSIPVLVGAATGANWAEAH